MKGPGSGCATCGHLSCVCQIAATHSADCPFRLASTGGIGIACDHGRDVCPICDACNCASRELVPSQVGKHHFKTLQQYGDKT